jgi:hypothetical protein
VVCSDSGWVCNDNRDKGREGGARAASSGASLEAEVEATSHIWVLGRPGVM